MVKPATFNEYTDEYTRVEGHRKDGPVAVARFELGESNEADQREARTLRQREVCSVIEQLLDRIDL